MMNNGKTSIIIVNYNGIKWLKDCLDSIYKQIYKNIEIIVVDNGSIDDSIVFIRDNYSNIKIIENKKNLGFGTANNLGVNIATGDLLLFLNNDIKIKDDHFLKKLIDFKAKNNLNITGPKILNFKEEDVYEGRKLSIDVTGYLGWGKKTFYIEGCALLISKDDFLNLGGFDEKYFMYSEDIDLCWRAHIYGMKIGLCESAEIIHFGGGSSETTQLKKNIKHVVPVLRRYEVEKNNIRNVLKSYSLPTIICVIPLIIIEILSESVLYLITGNWKIIRYIIGAVWWNIVNLEDTLKKRRRIQSLRIVSDRLILKKMIFGVNKLKAFLIIGLPKFK